MLPWASKNSIVCADSYFVSVSAAEELGKYGISFIGVINTSTRKFMMACLSNIEFHN